MGEGSGRNGDPDARFPSAGKQHDDNTATELGPARHSWPPLPTICDVVAEIIGPDLLIVLVVVALLFGGARLPKLARSLGSAKSEFEKGVREGASSTDAQTTRSDPDERVTLTRGELDALVAEREARAHRQVPPPI